MQRNDQLLGEEILTELLGFSPYFRKVGQVADYKLLMGLYGRLFLNLTGGTETGIEVVDQPKDVPDLDWGKLGRETFAKLLELEGYAEEIGEKQAYLQVLKIFASPFPPLRPLAGQEIQKDLKKRHSKKDLGQAKTFTRIAPGDPAAVEHCADCPGNQSKRAEGSPMRTFKGGRGQIKTLSEKIAEAREKALKGEDI